MIRYMTSSAPKVRHQWSLIRSRERPIALMPRLSSNSSAGVARQNSTHSQTAPTISRTTPPMTARP